MFQQFDPLQQDGQEARQPHLNRVKLFVTGSWRILAVFCLLAGVILISGQGVAHASSSSLSANPHEANTCDYRTWMIKPRLTLTIDDGSTLGYVASNMNGRATVQIYHNGSFIEEDYLSTWDGSAVYIYLSRGVEYANVCVHTVLVDDDGCDCNNANIGQPLTDRKEIQGLNIR